MNKEIAVHQRTILVVDDDLGVCSLMEEILKAENYHVLVAHDGLEAIKHTNISGHIDLMLMDIRMPLFSGLWFCAEFKKRKQTANIPIIIISAFIDADTEQKAKNMGAVATIKKPFHHTELIGLIEKYAY